MTKMMQKLIQIEARLSTLACFEGHTITEMLVEMLLNSCDMLNGMIDDLKEKEEAP